MRIIFALQEGGIQIPLGWVAAVVTALVGGIVALFWMVIKAKDQAQVDLKAANEALMAEKQKRFEDNMEHQRMISSIKERFGQRGGTDA